MSDSGDVELDKRRELEAEREHYASSTPPDPCHSVVPHGNYQKCPVRPSPPDQAAQEVDKLLGKFDPLDISHNDFVQLKPQIKAALLALMYRENLAVIGEDEPTEYAGTNASGSVWASKEVEKNAWRNLYRAELRQAAAQRYGQEGGDRG